MDTENKLLRRNNMLLAFITFVVAIALIAVVGWLILKPQVDIIQGQVEAKEVRVSGKVPGRISELRVSEGQSVEKGDTLAILDSPEVYAKLEQALAAEDAALAQSSKANKGARKEQIQSALALWEKAKAGLDIAEKSFKRLDNLYNRGVVSAQKRDEAKANYDVMKASELAASSQYQMALNGTQSEDKSAANALVNQAKGAVNEVESYIHETFLLSPIKGTISEIFPETGELVGTGSPVMNVMDKENAWVVFHVRENLLKNMQTGTEITGYVPALDENIQLTVFYMKDMGTYASWKATKTNGQYDLKTFEVKARPKKHIENLYPGMSVVIK
ncbi:MAG: efflux RND transporter periplasmic adaptor subunit [Dysgonamonadaceae bacterium]|jgi:HlyD family secretion protein|nr:efflux RND transporter periplasmic adaptor subunit [Dysgonamonadaceae bacterium]